jgi:transketolase C-terminal domain/subunit
VDLVTVVMPLNAYSMGGLNAEKAKLNKLCKVRKGKVGVAIGINYGEEDFRKVIKMIDGLKCGHITLLCQGGSIDKIVNAVNIIREKKFSKKVFVYSSVKTIEELSRLKSLKVDMIYSERFEEIGKELERKFGVEL